MDRSVTFDTLLVVSTINGTLRWDRASGAYAVRGPDGSVGSGVIPAG